MGHLRDNPMTYSKARLHSGVQRQPRTILEAYTLEADRLCELLGVDGRQRWPDPKYRDDPIAFAREVLGIEPWGDEQRGQIALMRAIQQHTRVAVRAGRKVSKSCTLAIMALWWYCCWYDAQVIMSSTTARQVDEILWRELRQMHDRSQRPVAPDDPGLTRNPALTTRAIDGEPRILARSGLASGFRRIAGFTAREGVAAQGVSGVHLLYLLDEASGIPQAVIDAIIGNMAASGCKLVLAGNPTHGEGEFYDAFNSKQATAEHPRGYHTLTISSEDSPNVRERREVVPGLAGLEWLEDREREWGRESVMFKVHVLGQHVELESGKIVSLQMLRDAEDAWNAEGENAVIGEGLLHIGIDPAFAKDGDEAVFVARRGLRMLALQAYRDLTEDAHLVHLLGMIREYALPGETPIVNVDALGEVGDRVKNVLRAYAEAHPDAFILCPIRASDNAVRDEAGFVRVRDELWGSLEAWLRAGGAILEDARMAKDLHAPSWTFDVRNRKIATPKKELRKILGRSPDRGDALCLAVWDNTRWAAARKAEQTPRQESRQSVLDEPASVGLDPYAGLDQWR